jgi:NAD(P)-dependent dehydrogenase (short-subunit alcohol dehydrogenase family)
MQIQNHAALVTGGGSGLGAATARALAASGAKVAVLDINEKAAAAIAAEIGGLAVPCNVADAASAEKAVAAARAAHGAARILINCAGIGPAARIVGREGPMPLDAFRQVIEINLIGSFNLMRLAAADMVGVEPLTDGERGIIISTASVAAYEGQIGQAAYSASKGGIVALTMPAAREFARSGIRVNTIAPGLFATPLLLGMPQNVQDSLAASVPFPSRFGTPQEYAKLALHITDNAMLNGETIRLDGALRMAPK